MKAEQILDQAKELPPPPQVAWKLMEFLKNPSQNNHDVVQIIEFDPVLTAKLLKACNSAFWSRGDPVATVRAALLKLGYREVQRIAMALSIGSALATENKGYGVNAMELWNHSVVTAVLSQKLGEMVFENEGDAEVAFTTGLLHDLGKTVLNYSVLEQVQKIKEHIEKNNKSMAEAEKEILGVDHAEIGACLLRRWNFPERVVEGVEKHHKPDLEKPVHMSAIVHLANCCAHQAGSSFGWNSLATRLDPGVLELLKMKEDDIEKMMIYVHQQLERISNFVSLI